MKTAVFTMGLPGAGKSTKARAAFPSFRVIDCDAIKETLPGYDPENPGAVHAESQRLRDAELAAALQGADSLIVDSTGTNAERMATEMRAARAAGFRVVLFYVVTPLQTAIARNAARRRKVARSIIRAKAATIQTAFDLLAFESDTVEIVFNGQNERG